MSEHLTGILNEIHAAIDSTLDADVMMEHVVAKAGSALGADITVVNLLEDGRWVIRHVTGVPSEFLGTGFRSVKGTISELAASVGELVVICDGRADDRIDPVIAQRNDLRGALAAPLFVRGQVVGVLVFRYNHPISEFSEEQKNFVRKLATSLSLSMENARLFQELEESNRKITAVLEGITDAFLAIDGDWRYTYVNSEAERLLERTREELLGHTIWEKYPASIGGTFYQGCHRAMSDRLPITFEHYSATVDRWFENRIYPSARGISVFFHDITDRRQREELGELLDRIHTAVNSTLDIGEILERVMSCSLEAFGADVATVSLRENGMWVPSHHIGMPEDVMGKSFSDEEAPMAAAVAGSRDVVAVEDVVGLPVSPFSLVRRVNALSSIAVPVIIRDEVAGVLVFSSNRRRVAFSDAQIDFARKLSSAVSLALDNADLFRNLQAESDHRGRLLGRMNRMVDASQAILRAETADELLETVISAARELTDAGIASLGPEPARGLLGAPLQGRDGSTCGYITVSGKPDGGEFTAEDEALLNQLAAAASLALQHLEARSEAERRAQEAEEGRRTLDALMEFVPEGIAIADGPDVQIRMVSKYGAKTFDLPTRPDAECPTRELGERSLRPMDGAGPVDRAHLPVVRAFRDGEVVAEEEWIVIERDGRKTPVLVNAGPIRDQSGNITGSIVVWRDISNIKRIHADLQQAYQRQMHFAEMLQRALAPRESLSVGAGYRTASKYQAPCPDSGERIGGDFFDVFETSAGKVGVVIGDVSGKGVQAAALAAAARSTVRAFVYETSSPGESLIRANAVLYPQQPWVSLVTVCLAVIDAHSGRITYACAGHPPPAVRRADGTVEFLGVGCPPFGVSHDTLFDERETSLGPGEKIVFYTDGISEARHEAVLFGTEGVGRVLTEHGHLDADGVLARLLESADSCAQGSIRDDVAVIVIERLGCRARCRTEQDSGGSV